MRPVLTFLVFVVLGVGCVAAQTADRICDAAALDVTVEGEWSEGAPMPTPRSELGAAALNGVIYIAGGLTNDVSDAFEAYDVAADSWETLQPLPIGLHHLGIAAYNDQIYVAGGFTDLNFTPDARVWTYDPEADTWTQLNDLPSPVGAHLLVVVDETLYLVGGVPGGTTLWAYNADDDSWKTSVAPMPTAREHLGATALEDRLIVVGGRWTAGNLQTVEAYDPVSDNWETLPDMPTPRGGFNVAAVDGRVYAAGGEEFSSGGCTFNRAEVYDPVDEAWARLPDMPTARHGLTMASVDGRWYVIGGATGAGGDTFTTTSDEVEIFTPEE